MFLILLLGMALSGAGLIAWEHRVHARPTAARQRDWLKYGVYLLYLSVLIGVRWWGWWPATVLVAALCVAAFFEVKQLCGRRWLLCLGVTLYAALGLGHLLLLDPTHWYFLMLVVAATDCYAQLIGKLWGRRQLCPQLSPGKTVEGLLGGLAAAAAVSCAVAYGGNGVAGSIVDTLPLGLVTAVAAVLGDLSFSWIKRSFGVKDFSQRLPGHGGILDRVDSMVLAAPALYVAARLMGYA